MLPRNREFCIKSTNEKKSILEKLEEMPDEVLESNLTLDAKKYYRMARAVSRELHYHKMFTRLRIEKNPILSGIIQPEHKIEDLILKFFYHRFPRFCIVLNSIKKNRVYFIGPIELQEKLKQNEDMVFKIEKDVLLGKTHLNLTTVILILSPHSKDNDFFDEILDTDLDLNTLFKEFYNSQYINSRENNRLFIQNMPLKYQRKKDMVVEKQFRTKTLDRFLDK
jgi:hypothetical protein